MFYRKWMINLLLAGLVVFLGMKAYDAASMKAAVPPDTAVEKKSAAASPVAIAVKDEVAASDYDLVVEKNLFASERKEIIPTVPEPKTKPKAKKPALKTSDKRTLARLALIGVVLFEDRKAALVQGATTGAKRGGSQWVFEGDEIGGMRVSEIRDEKILLTAGDEAIEILLYDSEKPKKRAAVKAANIKAQPTVLTTGTAGASPTASPKKTTPPKKALSAKKPPQKSAASAPAPGTTRAKRAAARKKNPS